jgi:hypothetical protein
MMKSDIFSRPAARKAAALGILGAMIFAIYAGFVAPMIDSAAAERDAQDDLKSAFERYSHAASDLPALEDKLAELERERAHDGGTIDAANETLAAAAIQSRIKSAVVDAGGKLQSVEVLRPESEGALQKIVVRARVAVELPGLQRVLYELNETSPVLFFESLDIARAEAVARDGTDRQARLDVDFTVFGYLRRPG